ncbi:MAG TPA: hypothetical protein VF103_08720 [Polyangiaceae bacterium]
MTDIEPWIEGDAPADVVEWLGAARRESPRDDVVERCAMLVAAGGVGLAAAVSKPLAGGSGLAGSSTAALSLLKWGAGGLLAGTLVVSGARVAGVTTGPSDRGAPASSLSVSVEVAPPRAPAPAPMAREAVPPVPEETAPPLAKAKASPARAATESGHPHASPDERLAEELALIDRVRASVDAHQPALAGRLLTEHEARFGKSAQCAPEARYLRVEVMLATGRMDEVRRLAREILDHDPSGPHAARARALLKESDPEGELRR